MTSFLLLNTPPSGVLIYAVHALCSVNSSLTRGRYTIIVAAVRVVRQLLSTISRVDYDRAALWIGLWCVQNALVEAFGRICRCYSMIGRSCYDASIAGAQPLDGTCGQRRKRGL